MNKINLIKIKLNIDSIIIGERIKGGVFRPCQNSLPSSTLEGAFRKHFNLEIAIVGYFCVNTYKIVDIVHSVRDKVLKNSKLPIFTQLLLPINRKQKIEAFIFMPYEIGLRVADTLKNSIFRLGALKSKGYGKTTIVDIQPTTDKESKIIQGFLKVKLYRDEIQHFNIKEISPLVSLLFKPDSNSISGKYVEALLPGSIVKGPKILIEEVTYYDV